MPTDKEQNLKLLTCSNCNSSGYLGWGRCKNCKAMQMGHYKRSKWLFWGYPLTREFIALNKGRAILEKIRVITAVTIGLFSLVWLGFIIYKTRKNRIT